MRLPNGYGSISKMSGNRRKPYVVRITTGFDDSGKQLTQVLGYYAKRQEALAVLAEHAKNPYEALPQKITFRELYERYAEEKYKNKNVPVPRIYSAAYNWCAGVHQMPFAEIKLATMQKVVDECPRSAKTKANIKILFSKLSKYAMGNDLITKNYAPLLDMPSFEKSEKHKPFSQEELKILWDSANDRDVQLVLILCYTGMRPSELLGMKRKNVNIEERYMIGGIKTAAGKDRAIPIAQKIKPFIEALYGSSEGCETLISRGGKSICLRTFNDRFFQPAMTRLHMSHFPHDGRHTCATLLAKANVDKLIRQRILGHAARDITDKVYTHTEIDQLISAVDCI